jgi:hypothetical protein
MLADSYSTQLVAIAALFKMRQKKRGCFSNPVKPHYEKIGSLN